jgi:hypothetical protein
MIFETLAAMADWNNNRKHDLTTTQSQANATLVGFRDRDGSVDQITNSGSLTLSNEVLTINGQTINNDKAGVYDEYLVALQNKTPRKVLEDTLSPDVLSEGVVRSGTV